MNRRRMLLSLIAVPLAALGQPHPPASGKKVELRGTIERVQIERGRGMPSLEVRAGGRLHRVLLGSMRYLIERDFNPKAGMAVIVTGLESGDLVFAIRVELPSEKISIRLRNDDGTPVWRGGWGRGRGGSVER